MKDDDLLKVAQEALDESTGEMYSDQRKDRRIQQSIAASLLVIARNSVSKPDLKSDAVEVVTDEDEINRRVGLKVDDYRKYWNPETALFEIDKGTNAEWICTEDELYDDVRKSVLSDIEDEQAVNLCPDCNEPMSGTHDGAKHDMRRKYGNRYGPKSGVLVD